VCLASSGAGADLWVIDVNGATAFTAAVETS